MKKLILISISIMSVLCYSNVLAQTTSKADYTSVYGEHPLQNVDLYLPVNKTLNKGLLIWIHGGGWINGDKTDDENLFLPILSSGFAVLNVNYRLGKDGVFPKSVSDIETVLSAVDKAGCKGCNDANFWKQVKIYSKNGIMISGASAGGYLSIFGGASYLLKNSPSFNLKCIGNIVGPVDFRIVDNYGSISKNLLLGYNQNNFSAQKLNEMSPAYWAEIGTLKSLNNKVSWFLTYSKEDAVVPLKTTQSFTNGLVISGAKVVQNITYGVSDGGHNITRDMIKGHLYQGVKQCFGLSSVIYQKMPWYLVGNRARNYNYNVGDYPLANKGSFSIDKNGIVKGRHVSQYCVFGGKAYVYNGQGQCLYSDGKWYPKTTSGVKLLSNTFTLGGVMNAKGYLNANWKEDSSNVMGSWSAQGYENGLLKMNINMGDGNVFVAYPK